MTEIPNMPLTGNATTTSALSTTAGMTATDFMVRLEAIRPKGPSGVLLTTSQSVTNKMHPIPYLSAGASVEGDTHINCGLFDPSEQDNLWHASDDCTVGAAMLVLDDVADKVGIPTLPPTFIIQTRPNNFQYGYVFTEIVAPEYAKGLFRAVAEGKLGDGYVKGRAQFWTRLPQSLPPDKVTKAITDGVDPETRRAVLIHFDGPTYTYAALCAGLGVSPTPEPVGGGGDGKFDPDSAENDPIWQWLVANEKVKRGRPDRKGFRDVECPNGGNHTDGTPWGRFIPSNKEGRGVFFCHHSGCTDLKMAHLRRWVASQGGPTVAEAEAYARQVEPFVMPDMPLTALPPGALPIGSEHLLPIPPQERVSEMVGDYQFVNRQMVANSHNATLVLQENQYANCFAFDQFAHRPVVLAPIPGDRRPTEPCPRPLEDQDYLTIHRQLQLNIGWHKIAKAVVMDAVDAACAMNGFHPIRDYLQSLPPVQTGLLDRWLIDIMGAEGDRDYLQQVGRKWLISAIARVMSPGCQVDAALILEGLQGYGKSSAFRILAGDDYFGDSLPDFHDKAAAEYLPGKWIVEMAELTGLRRSEVESMRAFLTRRTESFRPAYGRQVVDHKRQVVFCGSTNRDDYLRDPAGERRFWIVKITRPIDLATLTAVRDALWKEAYDAYASGEAWYLDKDIEEKARAIQQERVEEDAWVEIISAFTEPLADVCVKQCRDWLKDKHENVERGDVNHRIGRCLTQLGFVKETKRRRFAGQSEPVNVWKRV